MKVAVSRSFSKARRFAVAGLLVASTLQLVASPALAAPIGARHGLSSAQYQKAAEDFAKQGYRLTSVSGYRSGGTTRYAALWTKEPGAPQAARHGLTSSQYQDAVEDLAKQGFRLTYINGYDVGGEARYAAIWEKKGGPQWAARHGLTAAQYQKAVDDMAKSGLILSHFSAFSVSGSPRFAAIFEKGGPLRTARHGLTAAQYQNAFEDFGKQGFRLKLVNGYRQGNSDRYAGLWVKTGGPALAARHGLPDENYQHVFDNMYYQSFEPQYISAFNSASGVRFNGIWENTAFSAKDLMLIENKVAAYMKANKVPGLSVAFSKDNRLVYAAGFGEADQEKNELVAPTHRFRIASVSKPITHVAIERLIKDTNLTKSSKVFGSGSVLGSQYSTPSNNENIEDITVDHLIGHKAGFVRVNKDGDNSDPMFDYTGTTHKGLIEWALKNYPLGYTPGKTDLDSKTRYSNFGYCLLGRVIEAKSGKTYQSYVRSKILIPAGAGGMVIGGDKEAERKANEVKYYGSGAYSSVKPVRFDSHGGWIATPIDLLRFMKHETVFGSSYGHLGQMGGTSSALRRRSDGITYAGAANISATDSAEEMDTMLGEIANGVSKWPSHDLF
jgi:CubicO group peptidase (beta-lactamase class C family)